MQRTRRAPSRHAIAQRAQRSTHLQVCLPHVAADRHGGADLHPQGQLLHGAQDRRWQRGKGEGGSRRGGRGEGACRRAAASFPAGRGAGPCPPRPRPAGSLISSLFSTPGMTIWILLGLSTVTFELGNPLSARTCGFSAGRMEAGRWRWGWAQRCAGAKSQRMAGCSRTLHTLSVPPSAAFGGLPAAQRGAAQPGNARPTHRVNRLCLRLEGVPGDFHRAVVLLHARVPARRGGSGEAGRRCQVRGAIPAAPPGAVWRPAPPLATLLNSCQNCKPRPTPALLTSSSSLLQTPRPG